MSCVYVTTRCSKRISLQRREVRATSEPPESAVGSDDDEPSPTLQSARIVRHGQVSCSQQSEHLTTGRRAVFCRRGEQDAAR
jgi:hypothetical protein